MRNRWSGLALGLLVFGLIGCGQGDGGEDPNALPKVEYKTMEEAGKLSPEKEAEMLRQKDQRPEEDRNEGGL